jgi:1,4-alpha-glucan branching enzyme
MIDTKQVDGDGRVQITFTVPADRDAVSVVGDFNDWDPSALPMERQGDVRAASVEVDLGRRYAFRYVTRDGEWFDDDDVSEFEPNGLGGFNGVIDLTIGE